MSTCRLARLSPTPAAQKAQYLAYRAQATRWAATLDPVCHCRERLSIPHHAPVHVCEDGAFVEAVLWVPKADLPEDPLS